MIPPSHVDALAQLQSAYEQLRQDYEREVQARAQLQKTYDELAIMIRHQQKMFAMVKELYGEQVQVAAVDPITGLPNHRTVMSTIDEALLKSQQSQLACAVLFLDLDHFKHINDTYGHRAGDAVLQEVARRLRTNLRPGDVVGRYGGEEFTVILHHVEEDEAARTAERLRVAVASLSCTWEIEETCSIIEIPVTTSIGVAIYLKDGDTREALIKAADQAMYQAKQSGRNRVCLATKEPTPPLNSVTTSRASV